MGSAPEVAAIIFPFSSPFAMIARAAQDAAIWPHLLAIGWQAIWVAVIIRLGVWLFRRHVLKSGRSSRRRLFRRRSAMVK
jgi:ABC-2 type transport system permease protein